MGLGGLDVIFAELIKGLFRPKGISFPSESSPKPAVPLSKPALDLLLDLSRPWKGVAVHHSATPDGDTKSFDALKRYHMAYAIDGIEVTEAEWNTRKAAGQGSYFKKPWSDIGYHGVIERVSGQLQFHYGRPLYRDGAHGDVPRVEDTFNRDYIGLCVVGNFGTGEAKLDAKAVVPDQQLWDFTLMAVRAMMRAYAFSSDMVVGHRELYDIAGVPRQKTCPGSSWDMDKFRSELA